MSDDVAKVLMANSWLNLVKEWLEVVEVRNDDANGHRHDEGQ